MKKLGVILLVCMMFVFVTGLTNVVIASEDDLGGESSADTITIGTDPNPEPIVVPIPVPSNDPNPDPETDGDPYWDDNPIR